MRDQAAEEGSRVLFLRPGSGAGNALFPGGVTIDRNIARLFVATVIACLQLAAIIYGTPPSIAGLAACGAYIGWSIAALFPPRCGSFLFRMPGWGGRLVELALCGAVIATGGPVLVAFLAAALALFMPADYLRYLSRRAGMKAVAIAALVSSALVIGTRIAPQMLQASGGPLDAMFAALAFALFASALAGGRRAGSGLSWDDELAHHVAFASKAPPERLLELVAEGCGGPVVMVYVPSPGEPPVCRVHVDGTLVAISLPDGAASELCGPASLTRPFLFDTGRARLLYADGQGRVGLRDGTPFANAWHGLFGVLRGAALPFVLGRVEGWIYIASGKDLAHRSYLELRNAAAEIEGLTLRFERFDAWRERTLAEARLLASRDMHDSILQTLAGLRMQLGSMIKLGETEASAGLAAQIRSLDSIVAAEQQNLRAVLQRSREDARAAIELFSYLHGRALSLGRQWNLRCTVQLPDARLPVSEETAIECEFLLREAISNAAQHGKAEAVHLALGLDDNTLLVTLATQGQPQRETSRKGRGDAGESRSLQQRVHKLGGTSYLQATSVGGVLSIQIPLERK